MHYGNNYCSCNSCNSKTSSSIIYCGVTDTCVNVLNSSNLTQVIKAIIAFIKTLTVEITSDSLSVEVTNDDCGKVYAIELVPSTDEGNILTLGTDGLPYVPESEGGGTSLRFGKTGEDTSDTVNRGFSTSANFTIQNISGDLSNTWQRQPGQQSLNVLDLSLFSALTETHSPTIWSNSISGLNGTYTASIGTDGSYLRVSEMVDQAFIGIDPLGGPLNVKLATPDFIRFLTSEPSDTPYNQTTDDLTDKEVLVQDTVTGNVYRYTGEFGGGAEEFQLFTQNTPSIILSGSGNADDPLIATSTDQPPVNGLVYGGIVTWVEDYTYEITEAGYYIGGQFYVSPARLVATANPVVLNPADPADDRIDVFYVDDTPGTGVLEGTPSSTPDKPIVDPDTQIELSFALVSAATTEPVGFSQAQIYLNNVGEPTEWDAVQVSASINPDSVSSPLEGTKSIEGTNTANLDSVRFVNDAPITVGATYSVLTLKIRPKITGGNVNQKRLQFRWWLAAAPVGASVNVSHGQYGMDFTSATIQTLSIPLADFGILPTDNIDTLRITRAGNQQFGFWLDDIELQGVPVVLPGGGIETFLELLDTPDSYTGEAGKVVIVNGAENALEFVDFPASGISLGNYTDLYPNLTTIFVDAPLEIYDNGDGTAGIYYTPQLLRFGKTGEDVSDTVNRAFNQTTGNFLHTCGILASQDKAHYLLDSTRFQARAFLSGPNRSSHFQLNGDFTELYLSDSSTGQQAGLRTYIESSTTNVQLASDNFIKFTTGTFGEGVNNPIAYELTTADLTGMEPLVLDTANGVLYRYTGSLGGAPAWLLAGNTGTNPATDFVGTTDPQPLNFRVNDTPAGFISETNVGFGIEPLDSLTTGFDNVGIGNYAGYYMTSGNYNTLLGVDSGQSIVGGSYNSFLGKFSGFHNTDGNYNTGNGAYSLISNRTGEYNTGVGYTALAGDAPTYTPANGSGNTAVGAGSIITGSSGSFNTGIGRSSMGAAGIVTGSGNTTIGAESEINSLALNNATAIGYQSRVDADNSLVLGSVVGVNGATNTVNVGIGVNTPTSNLHIVNNQIASGSISKITSTSTLSNTGGYAGLDINLSGANVNGSQTIHGINSSVTNTGSFASNRGVYGTASGSSFVNVGVYGSGSGGFGYGVEGSGSYAGVFGTGSVAGVQGNSTNIGVLGSGTGSGIGLRGDSVNQTTIQAIRTPASTNTVLSVIEVVRGSSATAANGIGASIIFGSQDDGNAAFTSNEIISKTTDVTGAARKTELSFTGVHNNVTNTLLSISGAGIFTLTQGLADHVDDVAAAGGGIPVNGLYRTGSAVKIRVS